MVNIEYESEVNEVSEVNDTIGLFLFYILYILDYITTIFYIWNYPLSLLLLCRRTRFCLLIYEWFIPFALKEHGTFLCRIPCYLVQCRIQVSEYPFVDNGVLIAHPVFCIILNLCFDYTELLILVPPHTLSPPTII